MALEADDTEYVYARIMLESKDDGELEHMYQRMSENSMTKGNHRTWMRAIEDILSERKRKAGRDGE